MLLERYCICGDVLLTDVPRRKKGQALSVWYSRHAGQGHGECDAAAAEAARMGTGHPMGREAERLRQAKLGGTDGWRIAKVAITPEKEKP